MEKNKSENKIEKVKPYILVSSCLDGEPVRYNESSSTVEKLIKLVNEGKAVSFCPEIAAGFSIPREPAEIEQGKTAKDILAGKGKVLTKSGQDVTKEFIDGAEKLLFFCQKNEINTVILKEGSPSCGSEKTYDGSFTGNRVEGRGIAAELLIQSGIKVYSENNFPENI